MQAYSVQVDVERLGPVYVYNKWLQSCPLFLWQQPTVYNIYSRGRLLSFQLKHWNTTQSQWMTICIVCIWHSSRHCFVFVEVQTSSSALNHQFNETKLNDVATHESKLELFHSTSHHFFPSLLHNGVRRLQMLTHSNHCMSNSQRYRYNTGTHSQECKHTFLYYNQQEVVSHTSHL